MRFSGSAKYIGPLATLFVTVLSAFVSCSSSTASETPIPEPTYTKNPVISTTADDWTEPSGMTLAWGDEFNTSLIDTSKWVYETEATGWSKTWNNELQDYTDNGTGGANAYIDNGTLVIKAIKSGTSYTSARMATKGKYALKHGCVAAKMKLPYGQGIWPAFWMLPESGTWPSAGEIDVMELIGGGAGRDNKSFGTLHGPSYSGGNGIQGSATLASGNFSNDYHVFEIRWAEGNISWYVDGTLYHFASRDTVPGTWVFDDRNFYILLNLAVGGGWPGNPDLTTVFPQYMNVDWFRVYQ